MRKIAIIILVAMLVLPAGAATADDSGVTSTGGYPNLLFQTPPIQNVESARAAAADVRVDLAGLDLRRPSAPPPLRGSNDIVLYDQLVPFTDGALAQQFEQENEAFDAWAADDFSVIDINGWTVTAFNFHAGFLENGAEVHPPEGTLYNINVYPDDDRQPADTPVCSHAGVPGDWDGPSMQVRVELPEACELPTGNYWLEFQVVVDSPVRAFWLNSWFDITIFGRVARWRNPNGGFDNGCTESQPVSLCEVGSSIPNFLFQVIGQPNTDTRCTDEDLCLRLTVAPFDRDLPEQCGDQTSIDVNAGDRVNLCYRVTNNTGMTLDYQSLADTLGGELFTETALTLAPGETWQHNRVARVSETATVTATWSGQDILSGAYTANFIEDSDDFEDISAFGTQMDMPWGIPVGVEMPFEFDLYDTTTDEICVGRSGMIEVGVLSCQALSPPLANDHLPYLNFTTPVILPFWEMLWDEGTVYHATLGEAPNRRFIVQWHEKDRLGQQGDGRATFQVVIEEGTSRISFEYLDTEFGDPRYDFGADATVGLQHNTQYADQFSHNEPVIPSGSAIVWERIEPQVFTATAEVAIGTGTPQIALAAEALTGTAAIGGAVTVPLEMTNTGDGVLEWALGNGAHSAGSNHLPASRAATPPAARDWSFSTGPAPQGSETLFTRQSVAAWYDTDDVPAYAVDWAYGDLYRMSAENPRDWRSVGSYTGTFAEFLVSMDFLDGNFDLLYALEADARELVTLDVETAQMKVLGPLQGVDADSVTGFKQDPATGMLYLSTITGQGYDAFSQLWTLDLGTLQATLVGTISDSIAIIDIAFDAAGRLYGVDIGLDTFLAIDKESGQAEVVGELGFDANFASDLAFDFQTNRLYFLGVERVGGFNDMRELWTIDTATGAASHAGPLSATPWLISSSAVLAIAREPGACATAVDAPWLSWESAAGSVAAGETETANIVLDAGDLEPGTYQADLCVHTNDLQQPAVLVPVSFEVTEPGVLAVTPAALDFGEVEIGDGASEVIIVTNDAVEGAGVLTLSAPEFTGDDAFALGGDCVKGLSLEPQQSCAVEVFFAPDGQAEFTGEVTITAGDQSMAVSLFGAGVPGTPRPDGIFSDAFEQQ